MNRKKFVVSVTILMKNNNYFRATNNDEMCNFYLMYWVENSQPLEQKYCFSAGPPTYYWKQAEPGLRHIPDIEASTL